MSYPLYGNVFVDSSNNGGLGGTLSITNSANTHVLNNQASIAFGISDISYGVLGPGLIQDGVDSADARITAVIDTLTPATGTALTFKISGNHLLPPTEAMRISSDGNVSIGKTTAAYSLDVSGTMGIGGVSCIPTGNTAWMYESVTNGSNVASVANTWTARRLNTSVDPNTMVSLNTGTFTFSLKPGTYYFLGQTVYLNAGGVRTRLQNTTDATTSILGLSLYGASTDSKIAVCNGIFTVAATKSFQFQIYSTTANANGWGGLPGITGNPEYYTTCSVTKIA